MTIGARSIGNRGIGDNTLQVLPAISVSGPGSLTGVTVNISLGAPAGGLVQFLAGPTANIAIGAPAGSFALTGPTVHILLGAPAGSLKLFVLGATANILVGALPGSLETITSGPAILFYAGPAVARWVAGPATYRWTTGSAYVDYKTRSLTP